MASEIGPFLLLGAFVLLVLIAVCVEAYKRVGVAGILTALSVMPVVVGLFVLTPTAIGLGLIAAGCYLAIVARIWQAERLAAQLHRHISQGDVDR